MQMSQSGKINVVTIILLAALVGGIYAAVKFGPPYMRRYKVHSVLSDASNKAGRYGVSEEDSNITEVRKQTIAKIRALGVEDPNLDVRFKMKGKELHVSAHYTETIRHPIGKKVSRLRFTPAVRKDTSLVQATKE